MNDVLDKPLVYRCLALTGTMETSRRPPECFAAVTGNFDGQGLSFGALQWNLGQGTLQPLLRQVDAQDSTVLTQCFGGHSAELRAILQQNRSEQLKWARRIQTGGGNLLEPWKSAFQTLGHTAPCQDVQTSVATSLYKKALKLCSILNVWSERAVALMFDVKVQLGGFEQQTVDAIRVIYTTLTDDPSTSEGEQTRLTAIANRVALQSSPTFVEDVRNRKLTIANGNGIIHGIPFDLDAQFGIRLMPFQISTVPT